MLGILLSFDFLRNIKAFLKKGRTDSLGYGNYTARAEEFTIHPRPKKSMLVQQAKNRERKPASLSFEALLEVV